MMNMLGVAHVVKPVLTDDIYIAVYHTHIFEASLPRYPAGRGVFGQQLDPLVFENFSKFTTKRAKMTVKE